MSFDHHARRESSEPNRVQSELMRRFIDQINGTAKRQYPAGRMGAEDDGQLSYALATDDRNQTIIMRFGKPVEWVGLGVHDAEELIQSLTERVLYLKGVRV